METAKWNGKIYTAIEISETYELEKSVRLASTRKELMCSDEDCSNPILRYCHGEKRGAYFAHLNNCSCDYDKFDRDHTVTMRQVKRDLFTCFSARGFETQIDVKLLPNHYTHLLITLHDGKKVALELGKPSTTARRITDLAEQYRKKDIDVRWIIISEEETAVKENETYFIKRYSLNKSKKKDVLIVSSDGTTVTQYIVDPNTYIINGQYRRSKNYPDIYQEKRPVSDLIFDDGELCINGFYHRFSEWLEKKRKAFEKLKSQETIKKSLNFGDFPHGAILSSNGIHASYSRGFPHANQSVFADNENKKIRCIYCGFEGTVDKFWTYQGNSGKCKGCEGRGG